MEVTLLLIYVVMQICAPYTEAGFQMGCLVPNLKVTYFFNNDFQWLFLHSTNGTAVACLAALVLIEYRREPSAESHEKLACWG